MEVFWRPTSRKRQINQPVQPSRGLGVGQFTARCGRGFRQIPDLKRQWHRGLLQTQVSAFPEVLARQSALLRVSMAKNLYLVLQDWKQAQGSHCTWPRQPKLSFPVCDASSVSVAILGFPDNECGEDVARSKKQKSSQDELPPADLKQSGGSFCTSWHSQAAFQASPNRLAGQKPGWRCQR